MYGKFYLFVLLFSDKICEVANTDHTGNTIFSIYFIFRLVFVTNTLPYQLASFTFTICIPIFPAMSQRLFIAFGKTNTIYSGDGLIYVHWFCSISNIFLSQIIWRSVIFEINLIPSNVRHLDKAT